MPAGDSVRATATAVAATATVLSPSTERGFTYVWALAAVAFLALGLSVAGPRWSDATQRDREAELLRIGALYAEAIAAYRSASPGSLKHYPPSLDELLLDSRYIGIRRHLRKAYTDPLNPGQPLALVTDDDGAILGVYSPSTAKPFHRAELDLGVTRLPADAPSYADWKFVPKEPSS